MASLPPTSQCTLTTVTTTNLLGLDHHPASKKTPNPEPKILKPSTIKPETITTNLLGLDHHPALVHNLVRTCLLRRALHVDVHTSISIAGCEPQNEQDQEREGHVQLPRCDISRHSGHFWSLFGFGYALQVSRGPNLRLTPSLWVLSRTVQLLRLSLDGQNVPVEVLKAGASERKKKRG